MLATIHKPKDYIEAPSGTVSPVPMVKEFFQKLIEYKAIPPSDENVLVEEENTLTDQVILKDYTNKDLKTVIKELNSSGLDFQIVGGGGDTVVKQIPLANTAIDKNGKVLLYIESQDDNKELVAVPDTKNLSVDEAIKLINDIGFEVSVLEQEVTEREQEILDKNEQTTQNQEETQGEIIEKVEGNTNSDQSSKVVFEQIPEAGVFIEKGSIVKIKVK